jgi:hypothetical protein
MVGGVIAFLQGRNCQRGFFILSLCILGISGCSQRLDPALQTPITQETLRAYKPGQAINNSLQAGIAAQDSINISRFSYEEPPRVIFDQNLKYGEAKKLIYKPSGYEFDENPFDMQIWLVIFEGEFRITPPMATPFPLHHGCVYVMINSKDGMPLRIGGSECIEHWKTKTPSH